MIIGTGFKRLDKPLHTFLKDCDLHLVVKPFTSEYVVAIDSVFIIRQKPWVCRPNRGLDPWISHWCSGTPHRVYKVLVKVTHLCWLRFAKHWVTEWKHRDHHDTLAALEVIEVWTSGKLYEVILLYTKNTALPLVTRGTGNRKINASCYSMLQSFPCEWKTCLGLPGSNVMEQFYPPTSCQSWNRQK